MTTETTTTEPTEAKGLRGELESSLEREKDKDAEIQGLRTTILTDAYNKLDLDTSTGLGKAIAKEYDGEASFDALAEYAKSEYGHEAPESLTPQHPAAQQIAQGQNALDAAGQTAGSIAPPDGSEILAKAEADKDFNTTIAMKGAEINEMLHPKS